MDNREMQAHLAQETERGQIHQTHIADDQNVADTLRTTTMKLTHC